MEKRVRTYRRGREEGAVNFFKEGDKADPGSCRGITLVSTVGKAFSESLKHRMGTVLESGDKLSEGSSRV